MHKIVYKTICITAAAAMLSMAACGETNTEPVEAVVEVTETPTPEPTPEATPEPTEEPTPTETPTPTPTEEPEEEFKFIGEEKEGEQVFRVKLKNSTGKAIRGFSVRGFGAGEYPESYLTEGDSFADGETRLLCYDAAEVIAQNAEENATDENTPIVTPGYEIQLTFEDETTAELHSFPFGDVEEAEICLEEDVAYIRYTSASSGEEINTKEAEISEKQAAETADAAGTAQDEGTYRYEEEIIYTEPAPVYTEPAAPAPAEQAAPAPAEPAAPAPAEPAAPVYEEPAAPVYEEPAAPVYEEPAAPAPAEPAAPAPAEPAAPADGGQDACLPDGLTY